MTELVVKTIGILASIAAAVFALRQLLGWLFPIKIEPSIFIQLTDGGPDEIRATVTNRSRESLYLIKCLGRSANSLSYIARKHISRPFTKPRLYPCIWFGAPTYELMGRDPIKLEPGQPIQLSHKLNLSSPLFAFSTPMLQIEAKLSSGRTFRSSRLKIPRRWHVSHQIPPKKLDPADV